MKNKTGFFLLLGVICIFNLFGTSLLAQSLPGKGDSINSAVLNEKRFIQVVLPEKYKPGSTDKYDVLYVLDGEGNTRTINDIQHFIESESYMPPTIIVGILNTDRNRDFLPTHTQEIKTSGGADKFLRFFKDELIPYVNKTYPSNGENIIFGHSFGGVFVTYALLMEPQLFKSYIAADPSYWWDNGVMITMTAGKLANLTNLGKTFYFSGREGRGLTEMRIPPMDSLLKKLAPAGLTWKISAYPDETHGSVRLKSIYDGLRFTYEGYTTNAIAFHPMNGTVLKDKPFTLWWFADTANVKYTTGGTEPTISSAQIKTFNILDNPGKVTVKTFTSHPKYDKTVSGNFRTADYLPAVKLPKNMKPGGFDYAYYEGQWDSLPDFNKLMPVKTGKADSNFTLEKLPLKNNFGVVISGLIEIKEDGYYVFALNSDDGSKFYLNNQLLMNNDGLHSTGDPKSYIAPLRKGFYPMREEYFQKDGGRSLELQWVTPGSINSKQPKPLSIPLMQQYGKNSGN
jgi:predicted alpha/beta superfamily hydrolase